MIDFLLCLGAVVAFTVGTVPGFITAAVFVVAAWRHMDETEAR